jgi:hypothetical protein
MSEANIVTFEHDELGDACDELEALGLRFAEQLLVYLQKVQSKKVDHRTLNPFVTYEGVEMFLAGFGNEFAVFAVEIDALGDLKVSIMFAGQRNVPVAAGKFLWDGFDYDALRANVIIRRAAVWFD